MASAPEAIGVGHRRVNRPKDKDQLLIQLTDPESGPFREYRDVLVFAAALGWQRKRRVPLAARGEPIRWETASNRRGTEALVNMIAAAKHDDPEILTDERFHERLAIFEEYINGGLELLQAALRVPRAADEVVLELVQQALQATDEGEQVELASEADRLAW